MGTIMARKSPRSNRNQGRSRSREARNPSSRTVDRRRARQESPRPLLVLAITVSVVALLSDVATVSLVVAAFRRIGHIHLDLGIALFGIACTIIAVIAWREWWKARRRQSVSHVPQSEGNAKKETK